MDKQLLAMSLQALAVGVNALKFTNHPMIHYHRMVVQKDTANVVHIPLNKIMFGLDDIYYPSVATNLMLPIDIVVP